MTPTYPTKGTAWDKPPLTGWRDFSPTLSLRDRVDCSSAPVWAQRFAHGAPAWCWYVVVEGCAVACGTAPTREAAMDAADEQAPEWYDIGEERGVVPRPRVVCLCGSTRFFDAFQRAAFEETRAGRIVLSVGFYIHSAGQVHGEAVGCTEEQKIALDELHKRKIDLADEVLVINPGGYVGESTHSEIEYARAHGKPIRWLEPLQ